MLYYLTEEDEKFFSPLLKDAEKNAPLEYIHRYVPLILYFNQIRSEKNYFCVTCKSGMIPTNESC